MVEKTAAEMIASIKELKWSKIKLTQRGYRGAVQTYRTSKGSIVAVMFYTSEAFIVEDKMGLFGVQDLEEGLMKETSIDLEMTACIKGLSAVASIRGGQITYNDNLLRRLDIYTDANKLDIARRLQAVSQLEEMVDVDMGV